MPTTTTNNNYMKRVNTCFQPLILKVISFQWNKPKIGIVDNLEAH